jgi:DNA-binding MarR family transcriptional regulator
MTADPAWHRQQAPGYRLAVLHRLSAAYLAPRTRALGIRRAWVTFLLELLERPDQSQDSLSRTLCLDRAATARTLAALEARGYVTRAKDPANHRQNIVRPTDLAREAVAELEPVLAGHNEALFAGFDPTRRRLALEVLEHMAANLRAALARDVEPPASGGPDAPPE